MIACCGGIILFSCFEYDRCEQPSLVDSHTEQTILQHKEATFILSTTGRRVRYVHTTHITSCMATTNSTMLYDYSVSIGINMCKQRAIRINSYISNAVLVNTNCQHISMLYVYV